MEEDDNEYDANHDDDDEVIAPLRIRGEGPPVVETVTAEDTEEGDDD